MISKVKIITIKESVILIMMMLLLLLFLLLPEFELVKLRFIDTVYLIEMINSISASYLPLSMSNHSSLDLIPTLGMSAEVLCRNDLMPTLPLQTNAFRNHAYYILYLFVPFTWIMSAKTLSAILHVFPFVFFVLIIYLYLRNNQVSIVSAVLFCLLIIVHPNWSLAIQGQYYVDRLFIPIGLLIAISGFKIITADYKFRQFSYFIIITLLGSLVHERAALTAGGFIIAISILHYYDYKSKINRKAMIVTGLLIVTYSFLITRTFDGGAQESNYDRYVEFFSNMASVSSYFKTSAFKNGLILFLIVNVIFLGIFSFVYPGMALVAIAAMLPNIIGNIGGAEKTGWTTHYHSTYFPILVFCSSLGYVNLYKRYAISQTKTLAFYALTGFMIVGQLIFNPYIGGPNFSIDQLKSNVIINNYKYLTEDATINSQKFNIEKRSQINSLIPKGVVVTAEEAFFPSLYEGRTVFNYPIGVDIADFAVITIIENGNGVPMFNPPISVNIEENNSIVLAKCMRDRLLNAGYDLENPLKINGSNIAILKRLSSK